MESQICEVKKQNDSDNDLPISGAVGIFAGDYNCCIQFHPGTGIAQSIVCWAHCHVRCSIVGSTLL